jgi:hypothetical protein
MNKKPPRHTHRKFELVGPNAQPERTQQAEFPDLPVLRFRALCVSPVFFFEDYSIVSTVEVPCRFEDALHCTSSLCDFAHTKV